MATAFFASGKKGIDLSSYLQYCGPIDAALAVSASFFFFPPLDVLFLACV
jgi:hypothetical protein